MSGQLLRVGRASARNGGADGWIHRLGLGLASAAVLVSAWAFIITAVIFSARSERIQAREPIFATPDSAAIGSWIERVDDTAAGRQFSVIFLSSVQKGSQPPPGIPRWPQPGEAFLSPALLTQPESVELRQRYGHYVGPITLSGLADPGELLAYVGPRVSARPPTRPPTPRSDVKGFGSLGGNIYSFASQGSDRRPTDVYWVLTCLVGMPALVFAIVSVRSGAEKRDRRVALLEALGAPRRAQMWLLVGESAGAIAVGVGAAMIALSFMTFRDVTLPVTGYRIAAADVARARPALLTASLAVMIGMLALVVGLHSRPRPRTTTRPRGFGAPLPRWRLALFGLGICLSAGGAAVGHGLGQRLFLLGFIATLTGAPLLAGRISAGLGTLVAQAGARRGRVAAIVGGRWLAARPATIARLSSALIIGLGLLLQLQVRTTSYTADESAAAAVYQHVGSSILTVEARGIDQNSLTEFKAQIGTSQVVLQIDQLANDRTVLTAPCAALRRLASLDHCPTSATPLQDVYARGSVRALALRYWSGLVNQDALIRNATGAPSATTVGLLVLNGDGEAGVARVKKAAYVHLRTPIVFSPGQATIGGAHDRVRLASWVLLFGGAGLIVLAVLAAVSSATTFAQQARDLGPLATYASSRRLFVAVAMWNVTVPLGVAAVVGCGVATWLALLGLTLSGADSHAAISMSLILGAVIVLWGCAVAAGVLCAQVAARAARIWRPQSE